MLAPSSGDVTVKTGGVLSSLTIFDVLAEFPAKSCMDGEEIWLIPSLVTNCDAGQETTPLRLSAQVKPTVTLELFQPAALAAGFEVAVMVGGVLSSLTVTDVVAVNPAVFRAVPEITRFAPSVETVTGAEHELIPTLSEQLNVTVTSELSQPLALGNGLTVAVMLVNPFYDSLRSDPRFSELERRVAFKQ